MIDVLTHVTLGQADNSNLIRACVQEMCPELEGQYEVIVDYKGSQRPRTDEPYWEQGDWQVQTYAWLRSRQPESLPVVAGILIYINELTPGNKEMENLRKGIAEGTTDVVPASESDSQLIRMWRQGNDAEQLSVEFRLRRAIRITRITEDSKQTALDAFDDVVRRAEENIIEEARAGDILQAWSPQCEDEDTCSACDFRWFCPKKAGDPVGYVPGTPSAP